MSQGYLMPRFYLDCPYLYAQYKESLLTTSLGELKKNVFGTHVFHRVKNDGAIRNCH